MMNELTPNRTLDTAKDYRGTEETAIASSLIPYPTDDNRALYLGYMACGFSVREALQMVGVGKSALSNWRLEGQFRTAELKLPEIRRQLSREYVNLEFIRNFRFVMAKDLQIIKRSLGLDSDNPDMSMADQQYLLKMRSNYTPQQLGILEALIGGGVGGKEFNFAEFVSKNQDVFQMSRTDTITIKKSNNGDNVDG